MELCVHGLEKALGPPTAMALTFKNISLLGIGVEHA
jgi:hypothetical protein